MDEYTLGQVFEWYGRIEAQILDFGQRVPLISENESMEAPIVTSCILDACGLLDSFFRGFMPNSVVINGNKKNRDECNIEDFARFYSNTLDLPNTRSLMLTTPPSYRSPFEKWEGLNSPKADIQLAWWKTHNDLKHDRLINIKKAKLGVALDAVCALHQVIARISKSEVFALLIRFGWMTMGGYNAQLELRNLEQTGKLHAGPFIVQTKLFAVPVGEFPFHPPTPRKYQFPDDYKTIDTGRLCCKPEFRDFLGSTY